MPVPSALLHSPALVLRKYLIATGVVVNRPTPTPATLPDWIVYAFKLQAEGTPDNCVSVVNTTPVPGPRDMHGGVSYKHDGIQIMVRSREQETGFLKCATIARWLTEHLKNTDVDMGGTAYRLHAFTITSHPTYIGEEEKSVRHFHTLNGILALSEVTP